MINWVWKIKIIKLLTTHKCHIICNPHKELLVWCPGVFWLCHTKIDKIFLLVICHHQAAKICYKKNQLRHLLWDISKKFMVGQISVRQFLKWKTNAHRLSTWVYTYSPVNSQRIKEPVLIYNHSSQKVWKNQRIG
jgi:hypothetical protein